jgi:hypothetical protein
MRRIVLMVTVAAMLAAMLVFVGAASAQGVSGFRPQRF